MKETLQSNPPGTAPEKQSGPQGIGMAVAFDWGLTVELLLLPILPLFLGIPDSYRKLNLHAPLLNFVLIAVLWPIAIFFAVFGEGIRRSWRWTRPLQIAGNTLGFLGGFFLVMNVWRDIRVGNYWPIVPAFILLIVSPLIAWRLSRPSTARWFATVKSAEARKRHGGAWPWMIMLWSVIGGVLVALGTFTR